MKYFAIVTIILLNFTAIAQEAPVKNSEYKVVSVTYSSYSKPQASDLYNSNIYVNPEMFDDVQRNAGVTIQYSQMNFIKNFGIEYGIGLEMMFMSSQFNLSLPGSQSELVGLSSTRSNIANVNLPLYYVHKFELGNGLTLFPKIGVDTKVMMHRQTIGTGNYTDAENNLTYSVGHRSYREYTRFPLENVFVNGTIGASLGWATKNGGTLGIHVSLSTQLFDNAIITRINNIVNTKDNEVVFDSENHYSGYYYFDENGNQLWQPPARISDFTSENKTSNFSIGISYMFGK